MRFYLLFFVLFVSCGRQDAVKHTVKPGSFITTPGIYYSKSVNISVKEFYDGSLIFGIANRHNKLIYQLSMSNRLVNISNGFYILMRLKIFGFMMLIQTIL